MNISGEVKITVYEPDNCLKKGYRSLIAEIWDDLASNRWLTYQLFRRDFFAAYEQSFVGALWAFIIPLVSVGTFVVLQRSGIISVGAINVPYILYAVMGISFWQLFATGLVAGTNALVQAGPMVIKINFSKKSLIIASAGQALISFCIQLGFVLVLLVYYRIPPSFNVVFLPLFIIPLVLLTLGLSFLFAVLNGIMRDIGTMLLVTLPFLMFITPIFYARPVGGLLASVTRFNLLYYLICVPRNMILSGTMHELGAYAAACAAAIFLFGLSLYIFHLAETRVTERI